MFLIGNCMKRKENTFTRNDFLFIYFRKKVRVLGLYVPGRFGTGTLRDAQGML